jgi:hypothetical protein
MCRLNTQKRGEVRVHRIPDSISLYFMVYQLLELISISHVTSRCHRNRSDELTPSTPLSSCCNSPSHAGLLPYILSSLFTEMTYPCCVTSYIYIQCVIQNFTIQVSLATCFTLFLKAVSGLNLRTSVNIYSCK